MLEQFRQFISNNGDVPFKHIPFYIRWISACYGFLQLPFEQLTSSDKKQEFLRHLSKTHEEWQVKQADHALRLYNFFLSQTKRDLPTPASVQTQAEWRRAEQEMTQALRLRHRSLSTERSYCTWLRHQRLYPSKIPA
jgi:hypothetical protein